MQVIGIDENGLGPLLGPMIATAITLEINSKNNQYARAKYSRLGQKLGIVDSKQCSSFKHMKFAESMALAIVEAGCGKVPTNANELLRWLSIDTTARLQAHCPTATKPHCWSQNPPLPLYGGSLESGRQTIASLKKSGITILRSRSVVTCVKALNTAANLGISRFEVNLNTFERLLIDTRKKSLEKQLAICGMVGGIRDYTKYWKHFKPNQIKEVQSSKQCRAYAHSNIGEIRFEIDADDHHMPVAMASIVGKYLREILMMRQVSHYQKAVPSLPSCSGYHDATTRKFVEKSAPLRANSNIEDSCFQRTRANKKARQQPHAHVLTR